MFLISAKYVFVCDESFKVLENAAFVFDEHIREVGKFELLAKKYPGAKIIQTPENSLILPAFINPHTHLEFSANATTLHFGDFMLWLNSVMNSREKLSAAAKTELILSTIKQMQSSGTGTIGEISSFGSDLKACVKSSARIVFFNEILGANAAEAKKADFLKRLENSQKFASKRFIPAISVHSAYSTHPALAKFAIALAKRGKMPLSVHFLESEHEKKWLEKGRGAFKKWLKFTDKNPTPNYTQQSFAALFKGQRTLFTHCVWADDFEIFDAKSHFITHCAFSNRLLSKKKFALEKALNAGLCVNLGTDGLSSNISLSMLDELRANLLVHSDFKAKNLRFLKLKFDKENELINLAKILLLMATRNAAKALNLPLGEIKAGKIADFAVFKMSECDKTQLPLQFILHAKKCEKLFVGGISVKFR